MSLSAKINPTEISSIEIKEEARRLGFDHCRIVPVSEAKRADFFDAWIEQGRAGEMGYLERNIEKRRDPALLAESDPPYKSIIVLAVNHFQFALPPTLADDPSRGIIASYAWGDDYHEIIRPQLFALDAFIAQKSGRNTRGKCLVDTGPVLERDWAQTSGIGFTGKNCCIINPNEGSWLLLATILVPEDLPMDPPANPIHSAQTMAVADIIHGISPKQNLGQWSFALENSGEQVGTCGQCTRCIDACPTRAFVGPLHLDPQRCISYWTIEARSPIPRELRSSFGNRIFGCDICQEVCPWNQRLAERCPLLAGLTAQATPAASRVAPPLLEGFAPENPYWLDQAAFSARFRHSPIKRAKRHGMLRNVCVALGNWADPVTVGALQLALTDPHPLARGHAAWALGQVWVKHGVDVAKEALVAQLAVEDDVWVKEEIETGLH